MAVHSYNSKKVTCALGYHIVSGFAKDSMISIEYTGDGTTTNSGADGEIVRSIDPSQVYSLKLKLQQTSKTNAFLQKMYDLDKTSGNGIFSVNIRDLWGRNQVSAPMGWVVKPASFNRSNEAEDIEWELTIVEPEFK